MKIAIVLAVTIVLLAGFLAQAALAQSAPKVDVSVSPQAFNLSSGGTIIAYSTSNTIDPDMLLSVVNQGGTIVKYWDLRETSLGQYSLAWNGLDDLGKPVPDGTYTVNARVMYNVPAPSYPFQYSVPATGSSPGLFYYPYFVAIDAGGNVYISDDYHHCVQKFDANGLP
jgi:hypothetical protein